MKDIKQIRENFDLITEKEEKESQKLTALVRAGLYDAKKLPALKKALDKSADKMTGQEKRMLLNLLDSLIAQVTSDEQVYRKVKQNVHTMNEAKEDYLSKFDPRFKSGFPSDKDIPSVLILKRKAIRVYPDNQKVALYYSQALDKYVTIPFSDIQTGINEQTVPRKESKEEQKKRIAAQLAGGSRVGKMLRTGKVLSPKKSLIKRTGETVGKTVKNISDVAQRSGKAIAAGVLAGNIVKGALKSSYKGLAHHFYRVPEIEKKLQDRLARKKQLKVTARRKEVRDLTKQKRASQKAKAELAVARRKEVRDLTKQKRQVSAPSVPNVTNQTTTQQSVVSAPAKTKDTRKSQYQRRQERRKNQVPLTQPSPEKVAIQMAQNPNIDYSAGARKTAEKANIKESFHERLNLLREQRNLEEGKVSDFVYNDLDDFTVSSVGKDVAPITGTLRAAERTKRAWKKGEYGSAALNAIDTAFSGASDAALATGILSPVGVAMKGVSAGVKGAIKAGTKGYKAYQTYKAAKAARAAKTASKADDVVDAAKTASKADNAVDAAKAAKAAKADNLSKPSGPKRRGALTTTGKILTKAGRVAAKTAALGANALGAAAGGNDSSYVLSKKADPQFGKSQLFKSGSSFAQAQDSKRATGERTRQAQVKALSMEENQEFVLSKRAEPKTGMLKVRTSSASRRGNPFASRDEKARQLQVRALNMTESVIAQLKEMVTNDIQESTLAFNEQEININNTVAKKIVLVYESVNNKNKKKMEQMLNESATSFNKVLTFALRQ